MECSDLEVCIEGCLDDVLVLQGIKELRIHFGSVRIHEVNDSRLCFIVEHVADQHDLEVRRVAVCIRAVSDVL